MGLESMFVNFVSFGNRLGKIRVYIYLIRLVKKGLLVRFLFVRKLVICCDSWFGRVELYSVF